MRRFSLGIWILSFCTLDPSSQFSIANSGFWDCFFLGNGEGGKGETEYTVWHWLGIYGNMRDTVLGGRGVLRLCITLSRIVEFRYSVFGVGYVGG